MRLARCLHRRLTAGERPRIEPVARELASSVRSLQIRLQREGATYREVLDRVHREIALDPLRRPELTISDVAFRLGFSEQSAFTLAFRRWTGQTPGAYRKTRQGAALAWT